MSRISGIKLNKTPLYILNVSDILASFGAFLAVLIAIEIFQNITVYTRNDAIPVKLLIATALMAIARKVIVFDFIQGTPLFVLAIGIVVLALGSYLLVVEQGL